jgi:cytochrome c oxidase assembly factor CtaG
MIVAFAVLALGYIRGGRRLRRESAPVIGAWRAASFVVGLFLIWVALGSPLAAYGHHLLTVHMIQHLLLMTVAPALILLGEPCWCSGRECRDLFTSRPASGFKRHLCSSSCGSCPVRRSAGRFRR